MRENSKFRLLAEKTKNHRLSLDDTFLEHLGFPGIYIYNPIYILYEANDAPWFNHAPMT